MTVSPLNGNWIDLIILIFLAVYTFEGFRRGFLNLIAETASFIFSFLLGLRLYPLVSGLLIANFSLPLSLSNALGFIIITLAIETLLASLTSIIYRFFPDKIFNSRPNRFLGFLPALLDGIILAAFFLTVLIAFPIPGKVKSDILNSRIGAHLISQTRLIEKSLNQIFGPAIEDTLSFLTVKPGSSQSIDLHFKTSEFKSDEASEQKMIILINEERASRGLKPLLIDINLRIVARAHSQDMFTQGYFSHVSPNGKDPFDRMRSAGIKYQTAGENLAYAPNVSIANEGLMNSPGHAANILSPDFGHIGIGVINAGIYGRMFTQEFTD